MQRAIIDYVRDEGTIIAVFLHDVDEAGQRLGDTRLVCGEGNLTRQALHALYGEASPIGQPVRYCLDGFLLSSLSED